MKPIYCKTIPHSEHRYPTVGDYWETDDSIEVRVSDLGNPVMEAAIKIHEIVELALLKNRNVILSITDDFDIQFEQERSLGKHAPDDEPGDDPRCPYGPEHRFAENIERLFIERAGIRWDDYAARMPQ
jgi:hypothetical protein